MFWKETFSSFQQDSSKGECCGGKYPVLVQQYSSKGECVVRKHSVLFSNNTLLQVNVLEGKHSVLVYQHYSKWELFASKHSFLVQQHSSKCECCDGKHSVLFSSPLLKGMFWQETLSSCLAAIIKVNVLVGNIQFLFSSNYKGECCGEKHSVLVQQQL